MTVRHLSVSGRFSRDRQKKYLPIARVKVLPFGVSGAQYLVHPRKALEGVLKERRAPAQSE
jgi:hypothetical protein